MKKIIVMNAKGGCGKSTIATNLAGFYADAGFNTALFDYDPQGSSTQWLQRRPQGFPDIYGVSAYQRGAGVTRSWQLRVPDDVERVIIDTPAGVKPHEFYEYLKGVDIILVPVLPSSIDINATAEFLRGLLMEAKVGASHTHVAIIANRVKPRTVAFKKLECFLEGLNIPFIGKLRDTVNYLRAAELGLGVCELPIDKIKKDRQVWLELMSKIDADIGYAYEKESTPEPLPESRDKASANDARVIPFRAC